VVQLSAPELQQELERQGKELQQARLQLAALREQVGVVEQAIKSGGVIDTASHEEVLRQAKALRAERDAKQSESSIMHGKICSLKAECDALRGQVAATAGEGTRLEKVQLRCEELEAEKDDLQQQLNAGESKRRSSSFAITRSMSDMEAKLEQAGGSFFPRRTIRVAKERVAEIQSIALAQFALHMDLEVLRTAWKAWNQQARSTPKNNIDEERGDVKHEVGSREIDAANPVVGA